MSGQTLAEVLAETLCPPSHREGMVSMISGQPTKFGPRRICTLHAVQAQNLEAAVLAWIADRLDGAREGVAAGIWTALETWDPTDPRAVFTESHAYADAALAVVRGALGVTA